MAHVLLTFYIFRMTNRISEVRSKYPLSMTRIRCLWGALIPDDDSQDSCPLLLARLRKHKHDKLVKRLERLAVL